MTTVQSPLKLKHLPKDVQDLLACAKEVFVPQTRAELIDLSLGGEGNVKFEVAYDVPGKGRVVEANVVRARNGVVVNYTDAYMRRRDPDSMVIADGAPTDKTRFQDRFGKPFDSLRSEIFKWLGQQELILIPFRTGHNELGYDSLLVCPMNAAFFATGLADLQGMIPRGDLTESFNPRSIIYLAPPFRHTHCEGKQVVVHNRANDLHELFALNLYPGPSAKKGVYGVLLTIGETEGWIT
ncbi:MAG TPA: DUF4914 family protein, partial [Planctomycetota bacterium]|nr:DUF4914 family protein [Planctomycetota bacterium]